MKPQSKLAPQLRNMQAEATRTTRLIDKSKKLQGIWAKLRSPTRRSRKKRYRFGTEKHSIILNIVSRRVLQSRLHGDQTIGHGQSATTTQPTHLLSCTPSERGRTMETSNHSFPLKGVSPQISNHITRRNTRQPKPQQHFTTNNLYEGPQRAFEGRKAVVTGINALHNHSKHHLQHPLSSISTSYA